MLTLALVVVVRWTSSRVVVVVVLVSLPPCRVYSPVKGSERCSGGAMFAKRVSFIRKAPDAVQGEGPFYFVGLRYRAYYARPCTIIHTAGGLPTW